jgi:hypothetical protein
VTGIRELPHRNKVSMKREEEREGKGRGRREVYIPFRARLPCGPRCCHNSKPARDVVLLCAPVDGVTHTALIVDGNYLHDIDSSTVAASRSLIESFA